jgi:hypothetical protein
LNNANKKTAAILSLTAKSFGKGGLGEKLFTKSFSPNVSHQKVVAYLQQKV